MHFRFEVDKEKEICEKQKGKYEEIGITYENRVNYDD